MCVLQVWVWLGENLMLSKLAKSIFGSSNDRELRKMRKIVDRINQLEPELQALTPE